MDVSIFKSIEEVVTYPGYLSPEDLDAISAAPRLAERQRFV